MIYYTQALQKYRGVISANVGLGNWTHHDPAVTAAFVHVPFDPKAGVRYFGIEMELNDCLPLKRLQELIHPFGHVYHDGSPASEVVTSPATLRATKTIVRRFWRNFAKTDMHTGPAGHRGSHIHFSGSPAALKVAQFINLQDNKPFNDRIGQRNHWGIHGPLSYLKTRIAQVTANPFPKGWACSSRGKTFEVRIFRSPEGPDEVCKNVEYVDSLCAFYETDGKDAPFEVPPYLAWVKSRPEYPYLNKFLQKESI